MTESLIKSLAFLLLVGFLGILVAWVPRIDLSVLIGITVLLVALDFFAPRRR
jgi:hypothetical protein